MVARYGLKIIVMAKEELYSHLACHFKYQIEIRGDVTINNSSLA
jgi:hypothetical protein